MSNIENLEQLRAEISRMRNLAKQQEQQIKGDIRGIREDLKPENIFYNAITSMTGIHVSKNDFFKDGIAYGLSLILQRFVLKTERKVENKIYDFVDSIFERVKSVVNKFTGSDAKRGERKEAKEDFVEEE